MVPDWKPRSWKMAVPPAIGKARRCRRADVALACTHAAALRSASFHRWSFSCVAARCCCSSWPLAARSPPRTEPSSRAGAERCSLDGGGSAPRSLCLFRRLDARAQRGNAERRARRTLHRREAQGGGDPARGRQWRLSPARAALAHLRSLGALHRDVRDRAHRRSRSDRISLPVPSLGEGLPLPVLEAAGDLVFAGYGLSVAGVRSQRSRGALARGQGRRVRERRAAGTRLRASRCAARSALARRPPRRDHRAAASRDHRALHGTPGG